MYAWKKANWRRNNYNIIILYIWYLLLEEGCTLLIIVLIDVLQVNVERLSFWKRSSQHPSSLRASGLFISPLEQLLTWSFEVAADLGETGALAVNWVPTKDWNVVKGHHNMFTLGYNIDCHVSRNATIIFIMQRDLVLNWKHKQCYSTVCFCLSKYLVMWLLLTSSWPWVCKQLLGIQGEGAGCTWTWKA